MSKKRQPKAEKKPTLANSPTKLSLVFFNNVQTSANNVGKIGAKKPGLKTSVQNCL
jgi:hypothetical protein